MPDDESPATTADGDATTSEEGAAPPLPDAAQEVDYNALLDSVPDEILARHQRTQGRIGGIAQRLAEQERQRIAREEFDRARKEKEAELEKLAEENPFEFSQRYLTDRAKEKMQLELSELRTKAQRELFEKIGASYSALPDWQQLTPEEFGVIQQRVMGKSDEELVTAFNAAALDVIADRRSKSRVDKLVQERLAAERAAWEQEYQARRLRGEPSPDMAAPVSANGQSDVQAIKNMSDAEFEAFYKRFRT